MAPTEPTQKMPLLFVRAIRVAVTTVTMARAAGSPKDGVVAHNAKQSLRVLTIWGKILMTSWKFMKIHGVSSF